jgi:hypothetical protein
MLRWRMEVSQEKMAPPETHPESSSPTSRALRGASHGFPPRGGLKQTEADGAQP